MVTGWFMIFSKLACAHLQQICILKALANEDTLLRTHCCRPKCFPVCPCGQHLLWTQILCPVHKNVSDFVQKHCVSATNVSQFAQPKKHHGPQCVRNNVSSFTRALSISDLSRSQFVSTWKIKIGQETVK